MAQTYQCRLVGDGGRITVSALTAIDPGEVVIENGLFCFSPIGIAAGYDGTLLCGIAGPIVAVVKASGAIALGDAVYWDDDGDPYGGSAGTGAATTTATNNTAMGICVSAAGASDEFVLVALSPSRVTQGALENAITDPGNTAKAIPVTASGNCQLVSTGSDTRTLAAPSFAGQMLLLTHKTDGGSCVVTCATTVNETGNNTITFTNAGDSCLLHGTYDGTNLRWRCTSVDGAALSTV